MAGINDGVAGTLGGEVVGGSLGWTVDEGIGDGLAIRCGSGHIDGVTGRSLSGKMGGGALGLQLLATTVSSSSLSLDRMWSSCCCKFGADGPMAVFG
jgi:hypothetical protein